MYNRTRMVVEWDSGKARLNVSKHGISFPDAVIVLDEQLETALFGRVEIF